MLKLRGMSSQTTMTPEQSFFAVFCIEALADDLRITGDKIYKILTENSDILDNYILPYYDALHTQGKAYIVHEIKALMQKDGVL
ncbi:MAG: DUF3791 domain-containing protein [Treponema sp.]|jgi:hypothetical protein|nr:DUF3791 domain-containing protein [Treponema sp.]